MKKSTVIILLILVAIIAVYPLVTQQEAEFEGADGEAEEVITEINEDYEPWFEPLVGELPGEVESALFAIQAAIGASIIGYYFGSRKAQAAAKA